jgi:hypothetical protein
MADTPDIASGDPTSYQKIVGATFCKSEHRALIVIGKKSWSKLDLGRIYCPHPMAARRVQMAIQQLGITTPAQFIARAHEFGRLKHLGVTAYWTVLALCRDLGADIETVHGEQRSFHSIHTKALKRDAAPTTTRRRRKQSV